MDANFSGRLLGSTSLTPTYHKGGGGIVAMALTVAVSVAATWAAPMVAAAMTGVEVAAVTATQAAIAGAGLGAIGGGLTSAITGGNPLKGALMGAAGGAIGGYGQAGGFEGMFGAVAPADAGALMGDTPFRPGYGGDIAAAAGATEGLTAPAGATDYFSGADLAGYNAAPPVPDAASTLSSSVEPPVTSQGIRDALHSGANKSAADRAAGIQTPGTQVASLGDGVPVYDASGGYVTEPQWPASASMEAPTYGPGDIQNPANVAYTDPRLVPRTFAERASDFGGRMVDRLSQPDFYAEAGLKTGAMLGINALVNTPNMTPEQKRAYQMQEAAYEDQRRQAAEINALRAVKAGQFETMANYQDPNYQAAQDYATSLNRQKRVQAAAMAGVDPTARQRAASLQRGYALDTARTATGAFDTGYQRGQRQQAGLLQTAGSYAPLVDNSSLNRARTAAENANAQYQQLSAERKAASDIVTPLGSDLFGVNDLTAERQRQSQEAELEFLKRKQQAGVLFPPART